MASRRARCSQCGRAIQVPVEVEAYASSITIICSGCHSQGFNQQPSLRPNYSSVDNNNNITSFTNYPPPPTYGRQQFWQQPLRGPQPSMTPPSPYGNKRAVLFGISYGNRVNRIKGSLNDVHCMKYFLTEKLGFPANSIRMLTGTTN